MRPVPTIVGTLPWRLLNRTNQAHDQQPRSQPAIGPSLRPGPSATDLNPQSGLRSAPGPLRRGRLGLVARRRVVDNQCLAPLVDNFPGFGGARAEPGRARRSCGCGSRRGPKRRMTGSEEPATCPPGEPRCRQGGRHLSIGGEPPMLRIRRRFLAYPRHDRAAGFSRRRLRGRWRGSRHRARRWRGRP